MGAGMVAKEHGHCPAVMAGKAGRSRLAVLGAAKSWVAGPSPAFAGHDTKAIPCLLA